MISIRDARSLNMASESPVPKKVLLFGATGVIGKFILAELINAKDSFEKIGIFTSPGTIEKKKDEVEAAKEKGVSVVIGDVNSEEDVKKAYQGKFSLSINHPSLNLLQSSTFHQHHIQLYTLLQLQLII